MEEFDSIFEDSEEQGKEINKETVLSFKNLLEANGILKDEDLIIKWSSELSAIIYNDSKFGEPQLLKFKSKMIKANDKATENSNFKQIKQTANQQSIEITKGNAELFKNVQSAKKDRTFQSNKGVVDTEDVFRQQLGKEQMLDPTRFSFNSNLPQVQSEVNCVKNNANSTVNDLFTRYNPQKVPNYLTTNVDKIRSHLERRINLFKDRYFSRFLSGNEKFINDVESFSKAEEIKMVGRIVSTEKGFLNTSNVRIELSKNQYYDLVFEEDFNFGSLIIFPNQIVMVTGLLNERDNLVVSDLITYHQKEIVQEETPSLSDINQDDSQLIMVAIGPFSSIMSNHYSAFDNILHAAKQRKVSTLILLGPFVDIKNEILKDGIIMIDNKEYTYEQLQNSLFEKALKELDAHTKIIVVPSTRDILSSDSIPQMPLQINVTQRAKSLHLQSNPAYFELDNELSFYIANSDVGMITLQNSLLDKKMSFLQQSRLVYKTLFNQNNLYSLYPMRNPQDSNHILEIVKLLNINDFDVDFDHDLQVYPKIVISPSSLPKFAANINNTIVINPNYVIRDGTQAGNFAIITFFKNSSLPIHQRTRVDLYSL